MNESQITLLINFCITLLVGFVVTFLGWWLNSYSEKKRRKPSLYFRLLPHESVTEKHRRDKYSESDYAIEVYNTGQVPFYLESISLSGEDNFLLDDLSFDGHLVVLPHERREYVLNEQEAQSLEWYCEKYDSCEVTAHALRGDTHKFGDLDLSFILQQVQLRNSIIKEMDK